MEQEITFIIKMDQPSGWSLHITGTGADRKVRFALHWKDKPLSSHEAEITLNEFLLIAEEFSSLSTKEPDT